MSASDDVVAVVKNHLPEDCFDHRIEMRFGVMWYSCAAMIDGRKAVAKSNITGLVNHCEEGGVWPSCLAAEVAEAIMSAFDRLTRKTESSVNEIT